MTDGREHPADPRALQRQAEARLANHPAAGQRDVESLSGEQARSLLHELQVHRIELEMQNEELRDTQVALDLERARYFDLYDLAPVGYFTVSEQGLVKQANLAAASLLGATRSELPKRPWVHFIHRDDADLYHLHSRKLFESGDPQSCELRITRTDGTVFWAQWAATASSLADGQLEMRAVLSDITARKAAELALRESGEHYHNLFTSIDEGFCVVDMMFDELGRPVDYRFLELNPSFEKQSGLYNAAGKRARELVPNLEPHWYEIYGKVALTGEPVRIVSEARDMDGRWFDVHASRLGGPESRKVAIVFNDTTERVQVELKLREAKELADKANRAKSEFLSSMSHELRTPLNAILGFAQLLEDGSPPPSAAQKRNVDYILKAGWYLLALVDDILDLAVIESGRLSLSMESVPLDEVIGECQGMVEQQARTRGIRMEFPPFDAPCHVSADRRRVKQVVSNLLSNAIKYNRPGGSVYVNWVRASAERIRISVEDSGEGMSAETVAQLFQPFNRLGKETGPEQGTGIGLVVAKGLLEMMGGTIGVRSTVGKGSVFWFELSLAGDPASVAGATRDELPDAPAGHAGPPLRTLLYVEDNTANLALVQAIVSRRADLRLLTATNGEQGVELARVTLPDAVLMDIHLPGISGTRALEILLGDPATARIPVIALSANAIPSDIERGLAAGFFRYLTKPIKITEFMAAIDDAMAPSAPAAKRPPPRHQP